MVIVVAVGLVMIVPAVMVIVVVVGLVMIVPAVMVIVVVVGLVMTVPAVMVIVVVVGLVMTDIRGPKMVNVAVVLVVYGAMAEPLRQKRVPRVGAGLPEEVRRGLARIKASTKRNLRLTISRRVNKTTPKVSRNTRRERPNGRRAWRIAIGYETRRRQPLLARVPSQRHGNLERSEYRQRKSVARLCHTNCPTRNGSSKKCWETAEADERGEISIRQQNISMLAEPARLESSLNRYTSVPQRSWKSQKCTARRCTAKADGARQ